MMDIEEAIKIIEQSRSNICRPPEDKFKEALDVLINTVYKVTSIKIPMQFDLIKTKSFISEHFVPVDPETKKAINEYIESISVPTGVNIFDVLDGNNNQHNKIVCSAIKFHINKDGVDNDVVLCGARHHQIFMQLVALGFNPKEGYKEIEQGFVNTKGEFLNRKDAYKVALEAGQIKVKDSEELMSEDLY